MFHVIAGNKKVAVGCLVGVAGVGSAVIAYHIYQNKNKPTDEKLKLSGTNYDNKEDAEFKVEATDSHQPTTKKIQHEEKKLHNEGMLGEDGVSVKGCSGLTGEYQEQTPTMKDQQVTAKVKTGVASLVKAGKEEGKATEQVNSAKDAQSAMKEMQITVTNDQQMGAKCDMPLEKQQEISNLAAPKIVEKLPADNNQDTLGQTKTKEKSPLKQQSQLSSREGECSPHQKLPDEAALQLEAKQKSLLPTKMQYVDESIKSPDVHSQAGLSKQLNSAQGKGRGNESKSISHLGDEEMNSEHPSTSVERRPTETKKMHAEAEIDNEKVKEELQMYQSKKSSDLSVDSARALLQYLQSDDQHLVQRLLITIANLSTFRNNQEAFREAEAIVILTDMLKRSKNPTTKCSILQALNNLAVNERNQEDMEECVKVMLELLQCEIDTVILSSLRALTNLTVQSCYHHLFLSHITRIMTLFGSKNTYRKLQAVKVLVNLSDNKEVVKQMLICKAPDDIVQMVDPKVTESDLLIRVLRLFTNIIKICLNMKYSDLPISQSAVPQSLHFHKVLFSSDDLWTKISQLCKHANLDVQKLATDSWNMKTNINFYK